MINHLIVVAAVTLGATAALSAPIKNTPASSLLITNAGGAPVTDLAISAADGVVKLDKPLAPKGRTTVKLPKMSGCTVSVAASFEDDFTVELDTFDVCKDRTVRFTD